MSLAPKLDSAPPAKGPGRGVKLLHDPVRNKGTAFTEAEREQLGLRGLLPPRVLDQDLQERRILENLRRKPDDLERYIELAALQDRNESLFYRVVIDNLEEIMPIIYTPTVGKACQLYGHIFRRPRGLFISTADRGHIAELLRNWPHQDVRMMVVTDGERILGLGDLGADGMGIPIGKLSLYTACAGVPPTQCLPVTLDVGTDNEELLKDPLYIGTPRHRLRGEAFDELFGEFVEAVRTVFPRAVIQLEDFATTNAFRLLADYRDRACVFDDDIQGTAAVALAGFMAATRLTGQSLAEGRYLFYGAGEAGIGIGQLLVSEPVQAGLTEEAAKERCWFLDRKGLIVKSRAKLPPHKRPFARDAEPIDDLLTAVNTLKPTALVGASANPGAFTQPIVEAMARTNEQPLIFSLSNPTTKSECTAEQAYQWSAGKAIFASGSPFPPVIYDGRRLVPGQGNNAYVFPGLGLGLVTAHATRVTDQMLLAAARALAEETSDSDLGVGRIFPPMRRIRDVSVKIAMAVISTAHEQGLIGIEPPADLEELVRSQMFEPTYPNYAG